MMRAMFLAALLASGAAIAAQGPEPPKADEAAAPAPAPEKSGEKKPVFGGKERGPDIAGLLAEGYEVKGVLGGALLLMKDKKLFACNLAAVSDYKDQPNDEKPLFTKKCHPLHEAGPLPDTAVKP